MNPPVDVLHKVRGFAISHRHCRCGTKSLQITGMPGTFSPAAELKGNCEFAIPACITACAPRTCRDACRDCLPAVAGKTLPAFPTHAHPQIDVFGKRPIPLFHGDVVIYLCPKPKVGFMAGLNLAMWGSKNIWTRFLAYLQNFNI